MTPNQQRVIDIIANSEIVLMGPNGAIESRTIFGVHGDDDDLAVSLAWHDACGNMWEADFTEQRLDQAAFAENEITIVDSLGQRVTLSPMKMIALLV